MSLDKGTTSQSAKLVRSNQKQYVDNLIDSEIRYRRLFESSQDGILILDARTGAIEDVNPYLVKMLGYTREAILEKKLWDIGLFKNKKESKETFAKLKRKKYIRYENLPLKTIEGKLISVEFVSNVYNVGDAKVIQCNIRDITKHKRLVESLQINEKKYLDLVEQCPDGVFIIGSAGIILKSNKALRDDLGYSKEELESMKVWELFPESYLGQYKERLARILSGESLIEEPAEYEAIGKDGKSHSIEVFSAPHYSGEEIIGFQGFARNITARKHLERSLEMSNENLSMINNINEAANNGTGIEGLIEIFSEELGKIIPHFRSLSLSLFDSKAKFLELQNLPLAPPLVKAIEKLIGQPIPSILIPVGNDSLFNKIASGKQRVILKDPKQILQWIGGFAETALLTSRSRAKIKKLIPRIYKTLNINSMVVYPLIFSGQPIGLLDVSISEGVISEDNSIRVQKIVGQFTSVIQRKRAEDTTENKIRNLNALSAIEKAIASNIDLEPALSEITRHGMQELGVDAVDILVINPDSQVLEYGYGRGFRTSANKSAHIRLGESYAGQSALKRHLVNIPSLKDDPENDLLTNLLSGEDFVCYYGVPLISKGEVMGVLEVFNREELDTNTEWFDLLNSIAGLTAIAIENASLFGNLLQSKLEISDAYDATIEGWSRLLDMRDSETKGHSERVTKLTSKLANFFDFSEEEMQQIRWGALLHDIGKMGIPDRILLKPAPLSDEEWVVNKEHPVLAYKILSPVKYLQMALEIPYNHHEKWDGSGYPRGLKGDQIPLTARIFAVVDVWDALRSDRPYREAWTEQKAMDYMINQSGRHFDPDVVEVFTSVIEEEKVTTSSSHSQ